MGTFCYKDNFQHGGGMSLGNIAAFGAAVNVALLPALYWLFDPKVCRCVYACGRVFHAYVHAPLTITHPPHHPFTGVLGEQDAAHPGGAGGRVGHGPAPLRPPPHALRRGEQDKPVCRPSPPPSPPKTITTLITQKLDRPPNPQHKPTTKNKIQLFQAFWIPNSAWPLFLIRGLNFSEWQIGLLGLLGAVLGAVGAWMG